MPKISELSIDVSLDDPLGSKYYKNTNIYFEKTEQNFIINHISKMSLIPSKKGCKGLATTMLVFQFFIGCRMWKILQEAHSE
jgi:hypothetical protein